MGVIGSVSLVQNAVLSSQPVSSFDWHPDKVSMQCVCVCVLCAVCCRRESGIRDLMGEIEKQEQAAEDIISEMVSLVRCV